MHSQVDRPDIRKRISYQNTFKLLIMGRLMAIPFRYKEKEYYSLVRFITVADDTVLRVTIMDGELDRMLAGKNLLYYNNGRLNGDPSSELQCLLAEELNKLKLENPSF